MPSEYEQAQEFVNNVQARIQEWVNWYLPKCQIYTADESDNYSSSTLDALRNQKSKSKLVLFQYEPWSCKRKSAVGGESVASVLSRDVDSLVVQVYAKLSGAPLVVNTRAEPQASSDEKLPFAVGTDSVSGVHVLHGVERILEYYKQCGYDLDQHLSDMEKAEALAYCCLIEEKLRPALVYFMFADTLNYSYFTRYLFYHTKDPWIVGALKARKKRKEEIHWLRQTLKRNVFGDSAVARKTLEQEFRDGLKQLQTMLASNSHPYMMDTKPSTVDAYLFAYLDIIYEFGDSYEQKDSHVLDEGRVNFMLHSRLKDILIEYDAILNWYLNMKQKWSF